MKPAKVRKTTELSAMVLPPCQVCGAPYRPSKPIAAETIHFDSKDWLANCLYRLERFIVRLRKARMRTL